MFMQKSIDGYVYTPFTNKLCLLLGVSNTIFQTLNSNMRATISSLAKISQGKRSVFIKFDKLYIFSAKKYYTENIILWIIDCLPII